MKTLKELLKTFGVENDVIHYYPGITFISEFTKRISNSDGTYEIRGVLALSVELFEAGMEYNYKFIYHTEDKTIVFYPDSCKYGSFVDTPDFLQDYDKINHDVITCEYLYEIFSHIFAEISPKHECDLFAVESIPSESNKFVSYRDFELDDGWKIDECHFGINCRSALFISTDIKKESICDTFDRVTNFMRMIQYNKFVTSMVNLKTVSNNGEPFRIDVNIEDISSSLDYVMIMLRSDSFAQILGFTIIKINHSIDTPSTIRGDIIVNYVSQDRFKPLISYDMFKISLLSAIRAYKGSYTQKKGLIYTHTDENNSFTYRLYATYFGGKESNLVIDDAYWIFFKSLMEAQKSWLKTEETYPFENGNKNIYYQIDDIRAKVRCDAEEE